MRTKVCYAHKFLRNDSPNGSGVGVRKHSNFKNMNLLYEHVIYHLKAHDLEIPLIKIFSEIFEFHENTSKKSVAEFFEVFIKSRNLSISRK